LNKNYLASILKEVKTIAVVGASSNPERDSHKVMEFLINYGFDVYPVNPNEANNIILGRKCFSNLNEIKEKIDMVDVFRAKEYVLDITKEAIGLNADILWTQEGIVDEQSAVLANDAGLKVVMDKCPKKILEY
tara:strand:+ start:317 stop:715 length:399 start_codon:yes stop_codon:yes gene_type:complete